VKLIPRFTYHRPDSLDEACSLMEQLTSVKAIAGGTDLLVQIKDGLPAPKHVIDLTVIEELHHIDEDNESIIIGATITLADIIKSRVIADNAPVLVKAANLVGSPQIRNVGTLGGNLCNASPAADLVPPLLALDAKLKILSRDATRSVPLNEFFLGPGQSVLRRNELVSQIRIPKKAEHTGTSFLKLGRRKTFTLSVVTAAACVELKDKMLKNVRIALGAVAPTPIRAWRTEKFLIGQKISDKLVDGAAELAKTEVAPITDVRASAEYRREMSGALVSQGILNAASEVEF